MYRKPATYVGYDRTGGSRAVKHLRNIFAEEQVVSLKNTVQIGMKWLLLGKVCHENHLAMA
jgi:hypothetical protein